MKTFAELEQQERDLQKQLQQTRMDKIRAKAAENRAQQAAKMTVDDLAAQQKRDAVLNAAFSTPDGQAALELLKAERPVIADDISEAMARIAAPVNIVQPGPPIQNNPGQPILNAGVASPPN